MKINKKIIISVIAVIIIAAVGVATSSITNNKKNDVSTIRIAGLQGPTSIGMIKMIEEKPMIAKVPSTYEIVKTTDLLVSKLQSNEFDIAAIPVNLAANVYNKGMDYQLLGVNILNNIYVIGTDSNVKDLKDLKGKTVNILGKGATPDILFNYIMTKNGIDTTKDITIDFSMQQTELAQALIAGKVNYAVLPEPFVSQVMSKNPKVKILFDIQDEFNKVSGSNVSITHGGIVVNKTFAAKHKKLVDEFVKQYAASIEFVNNNPVEAATMSEKYSLGVTSAIAKTAIPRSNIVFISANDSKQDVNNFLKLLYDFSPKSIGDKMPDDNFFYKK